MGKEEGPEKGTGACARGPDRTMILRNRLLEAGQRVFAETGYAGTRVDDIIEAANTSRATFYRYFKSKNALFTELSRICFVDMRVTTRAIASVTPEKRRCGELIELLKHWRDLLDSHGGVIRLPVRTGRRPRFHHLGRSYEGLRRPLRRAVEPDHGGQDRVPGSIPRSKRRCCSS